MDSKSFLLSKTLLGIAIAFVSALLKRHGVEVDADGLTNDLVSAGGLAFAAYGRFKATQPIHVLPGPRTNDGGGPGPGGPH